MKNEKTDRMPSGGGHAAGLPVPDSLLSLDGEAFQGCVSLRTVNYPKSLEEAGDDPFLGCTSFVSVTVPEGVTVLAAHSLSGGPALRTMTVPEGVTALPVEAFGKATGLVTVYLPSTLTRIGEYAFSECSNLRQIVLPESVAVVGYRAFRDCPRLETLVVYAMNTLFCEYTLEDLPLATVYGWNNSDAILYAMQNGYPFELLGEGGDYSGYVTDMSKTSFIADSAAVTNGQTVAFTLSWTLKTPQPEDLSDLRLRLSLSDTLSLNASSLRLNGSAVSNATVSGGELTVPVTGTSGTLSFSAVSSGTAASAFAQLLYTLDGTEKADTIGTLELDGSAAQGGYVYVYLGRENGQYRVLLRNGQAQSAAIVAALASYGEDGHMLSCAFAPLTLGAGERVSLLLAASEQATMLKAFTLEPQTYAPLSTAWSYGIG